MSPQEQNQWKDEVNRRFSTLEKRLGEVDEKLDVNTQTTEQARALSEETRDNLNTFVARAEPTLDITEPMLRGAAIIGKTASFLHKWGSRAFKAGLWILAFYLAGKAILTGAGWSEGSRVFWETVK